MKEWKTNPFCFGLRDEIELKLRKAKVNLVIAVPVARNTYTLLVFGNKKNPKNDYRSFDTLYLSDDKICALASLGIRYEYLDNCLKSV
jgi:hypothetical protein